ncbi:MAG: protein rep [Tenericutes bacterium]|nr:protein rep [Mycoplasmatota bacterium]
MIFDRLDLRTYEHSTFAVKCSKRGNDVYRKRVYRRFKQLSQLADETNFFNPKDRSPNKKTKALFVTLTYDTKLCSFSSAWKNIGVEFNRFMAFVRKNIGEVSCCRVFEAYENGHPHIHCVLLFNKEFTVFRDGKGQFRINEKEIISRGWHSHVDIKAIYSLGRGFSYLKKYLLKSIDAEKKDSKALKTLALCWLFNKRAFSVSGKFRQLLIDLIKTKHNSNHKKSQITLIGEPIEFFIFTFVGIVPYNILNLTKHQQKTRFISLTRNQTKSTYDFLEKRV